jgi:hypothetical protein
MKFKALPILLLFVFGCLKENQDPQDIYWGTASAEINGEARDLKPYCETNGIYLNIVLDYINEANKLVYHVNLGHIQTKMYTTDTFAVYSNVPPNTSEWTNLVSLMSDGVTVGNIYKSLETEVNTVEVTDWNPINREVKGKFNITYVLDPAWPVNDPLAPDTIRLVNGVFYTRV